VSFEADSLCHTWTSIGAIIAEECQPEESDVDCVPQQLLEMEKFRQISVVCHLLKYLAVDSRKTKNHWAIQSETRPNSCP